MHVKRGRKSAAIVCASVLAAVLTGCGGDDVKPADDSGAVSTVEESPEAAATPSTDADMDLPGEHDLNVYFTAVSTYDVDDLEEALTLTEPGSIAEAYAGYLLASANSAVDAGSPIEGEQPEKVDGGYESCDSGDCVKWADIEGCGGKIVSFTVNGEDLSDRLSVGNGRPIPAGDLGSVELLYAYQSVQSNALFVVAKVQSAQKPITAALYDATYRATDGRQSKAAQTSGPTDFGANSTATVIMAFPGAKPGGVATLSLFSDDFMTERPVELKTR